MFQRLAMAAAAGMLEARCGCYRAAASSSCKCAGTCHAVRPVESMGQRGRQGQSGDERDLGYPLHSPAARILHTEIAGEGGEPGICLIDGYQIIIGLREPLMAPASLQTNSDPVLSAGCNA